MEKIRFSRIKNDTNGNPRYVCHFLDLLTKEESNAPVWLENGQRNDKYATALARAKKIGGRKFHNKQYGGGIVFSSYNLETEAREIAHLTGREYAGYVVE